MNNQPDWLRERATTTGIATIIERVLDELRLGREKAARDVEQLETSRRRAIEIGQARIRRMYEECQEYLKRK